MIAQSFLLQTVIVIICLFEPIMLSARQNAGNLTGEVIDAETKAPVEGASIVVEPIHIAGQSNADGSFVFNDLPAGRYTLQVSHVGYETQWTDTVTVTEDRNEPVTVRLKSRLISLKGIVVTPGYFSVVDSQPTSHQTLPQQAISNMPQLGDDAFRAVTRLPGISTGDFTARFSVRGGEYDEIMATLDGLRLYEPFHLKEVDGGAISIIDAGVLQSVDLMTGGYPARYGGKLSGVFDMRTRQVQPGKTRVSVGASFITARAMGEGTFAHNKGSWLVSARKGYAEYVADLVQDDRHIKPRYYDLFGKFQYQLGSKSVLALHALQAHDNLLFIGEEENPGDTVRSWSDNSYIWLTLWSGFNSKLTSQTVAAVGRVKHRRAAAITFEWSEFPSYSAEYDRRLSFAQLKTDWDYDLTKSLFFKAGIEAQLDWATYDYFCQDYKWALVYKNHQWVYELAWIDTTSANADKSGWRGGGYLSARARLVPSLVTEIGARFDRADYSGDHVVSPRVSVAFSPGSRATVRFAWGHYYQPEGVDEVAVNYGETGFYPAQKATHTVVGYEQQLPGRVQFRAEVYRKRYTRLRPTFRNEANVFSIFPEKESGRTIVHRARCESRGVEFFVKKDNGGVLSWWANYTWSKVEDSLNFIHFPESHGADYYGAIVPGTQDQRHAFHFDVNIRPTPRWLISSSFQLHTGWPYTEFYLDASSEIEPDSLWQAKFSAFQRWDLRLSRYFPLSSGKITAYVELFNVLGRKNVRYYDYDIVGSGQNAYLRRSGDYWFGRLPSLGISYDREF